MVNQHFVNVFFHEAPIFGVYKVPNILRLQIANARFIIWDRETGKPIAKSPTLHIDKIATQPFDFSLLSLKNGTRPKLRFSQSRNSVLVMHPGFSDPIDVCALYR
jgi:hypothetical protein